MDFGSGTALPFFFVDVFADSPLNGNPVTLVPDAEGLSVAQMRAVAREFNRSETTFLLAARLPGATWRLRSFTPSGAEVLGAGHNALGAWLWLAAANRISSAETDFAQEIGEQVLPVRLIREPGRPVTVAMEQSPPRFGGSVTDRGGLAAALGRSEGDLAPEPAQVVDTGAGPLTALLVRTGKTDPGTSVIEQGHALGRPSRIEVGVTGQRVTVSGSGLVVAEGTLYF